MKIPIELAVNLLKAIGDKTRLQILVLLQDGKKNVNEISTFLKKPQPRISGHLKTLIDQGILIFKQDKQKRYFQVKNNGIYDVIAAITSIIPENAGDTLNNDDLMQAQVQVLELLAQATRLQILEILADGTKPSSAIQETLLKCQSTICDHLTALVDNGILTFDQSGPQKMYKIQSPRITDVLATIASYIAVINKNKIESIAAHDIQDTLL
ncbi:MAG TPA: metalloregulator ArsR/SmtB family transcription factor [Candidatus Lokiarchaeia archaeon]|nr:metalloregulator ArsR/SmtB family transcription factor [Candidatus Lokiarchaeia archaeon]